MIVLLSAIFTTSTQADQMAGFIGSSIPLKDVNPNDGRIEPGWADVKIFQDLMEFGSDGQVKFANNGTHLFALLTTSIDIGWISIEFNADNLDCMDENNDGWTFYINAQSGEVEAQDVYFIGSDYPIEDIQNDLKFETLITGNLMQIEIIRAFNTGDGSGKDTIFSNGTLAYLRFASKAYHYSSETIYYLSIQISETGGIEELVIMEDTDWDKLKLIILQLGILGALLFISAHIGVRVINRPLQHGNRIVNSTWKAPSFKERLHEITTPDPIIASEEPDIPKSPVKSNIKRSW